MLPHLLSRLRQRLLTAPSGRPARAPARLGLERLEDRLAPAVLAVISTADNTNAVITAGHAGTAADPFLAPSLRSAISFVNNATDGANNVINLAVAGTYKIALAGTPGETDNAAGEFAILPSGTNGSSLTIQNTSGGTAVVDANHFNRVFDINPNNVTTAPKFAVTMQGFTITGGDAFDPRNPDGATSSGGGIRDQNNVSLTLTNMVLTDNVANADGGGVSMENAPASTPWTLTLTNTVVSGNHAGDAGGGVETDGTGKVFITGGQLTGNTTVNQGAAVWLDAIGTGSANLTLTNVLVNGNAAQNGPTGAIGNAGTGAVVIIGSTIEDNSSGTTGGGFGDQNNLGTLSVSNSLFLNNSAIGNGGGIQEGGPSTAITNTSLRGNSSGGSGGGLFANGTTLAVTGSTIVNNTAGTAGGGVEVQTTGTGASASTITNTTITGNSALNNAGANGGGIDAPAGFAGTLTLLNDTINGNFATNGGGIFWAGAGTSVFTLQNTIVAQNSAGTAPDADNPAGTFTDGGGNLIGVSGAGSGNTGFTAGTTQTGTAATPLDPKLGPPQDNGGPAVGVTGLTLETEALLTGSPALDRGVPAGAPATDERGFARPDGPAGESPDVGAFEFQDATLSVTVMPSSPAVALGSTATFAVVVTDTSGNALPADNSTVTVGLSGGLAPATATTFTLGALAAGQGRTFTVSATATALGAQTVTATVASPDTTPPSVSAGATINVTPAPPVRASFDFTTAFIQLEVEAYYLTLDFAARFNEGGAPDPVLDARINQLLAVAFANPLYGTASGFFAETLGYDLALPILMFV